MSFLLSFSCVFSVFFDLWIFLVSHECQSSSVPSIDAAIWYCVATKHQRKDDLHQANLLKQTFHTSAQVL